mmetsp:Transcript_3521/g.8977  ORF Transcript_3521/g.8977 Transcript_3521/m.8977 type:complete len:208 (-) Transcript_3521:539-1162(-)
MALISYRIMIFLSMQPKTYPAINSHHFHLRLEFRYCATYFDMCERECNSTLIIICQRSNLANKRIPTLSALRDILQVFDILQRPTLESQPLPHHLGKQWREQLHQRAKQLWQIQHQRPSINARVVLSSQLRRSAQRLAEVCAPTHERHSLQIVPRNNHYERIRFHASHVGHRGVDLLAIQEELHHLIDRDGRHEAVVVDLAGPNAVE